MVKVKVGSGRQRWCVLDMASTHFKDRSFRVERYCTSTRVCKCVPACITYLFSRSTVLV